MKFRTLYLLVILGVCISCKKGKDNSGSTTSPDAPVNQATPSFNNLSISTDKAAYSPGDDVTFTIDNSALPGSAKVRYKYLNTILSDAPITNATWKWKAPATDYRGYIAEVYAINNNTETIYAVIAVDVSSDWKKFPRYGFLSKFPQLADAEVNGIINNLNRYHINGLQFYDWHNKHHKPLPMNGSIPESSWKDVFNRDIYLSTVEKYINSAHGRNMKAMFYNLIYGAWDDGEADGVAKEWYVYNDANHGSKDFHPLPSPPFLSNIYLLDPSNTSWQQYLKNENKKVYQHLAFDGFHMDQLGGRGTKYKYNGSVLNLADTYKPFIDAIRADEPNKDIVMNAVSQYGQTGIAQSAADFLYTEVWDPYNSYTDLVNIIKANNTYSNNTKNTVLAAYMNYDLANNKGVFNTASVVMTNAVIFAFGGSHLEMGEHMLGKEYFPNDNLEMKEDLKKAMVSYYDFLVAYQNLLRDGGTFNTVSLTSIDGKVNPSPWPNIQGAVSVVAKKVGSSQVIHLINFKNSKTTNWRDNTGIQPAPIQIKDAKLALNSTAPVKKVWVASPDNIGGASRSVNFTQSGDKVSFTLPELQYWSMIVVEY
ncbi:glycoside hydrolase family 66 protein [Pedobacter sp. P351]|uniref:glycoside hydrolase family 66 protein n=1 Tax=Pedobacter superstes TaxID=3133441 RepID=UPI00309ABE20